MASSIAQLLFLVVGLFTIFTSPTNAHPLLPRQAPAAGYLAAAFLGNVPSVFFHVAPPDSPSTFQRLNGGQPSLVPTQGTKGARDPFIFFSQDRSKVRLFALSKHVATGLIRLRQLYVLATDLDIGKTNWNAAQTNGSRSIFIWESSDGVNWSQDRLVELMPSTAGYVSILSKCF